MAQEQGHTAVLGRLRSLETDEQRWLHAAEDGDMKELTRQLDKGCVEIDGLLETVNNEGNTIQTTVLDIATGQRREPVVRLLLNRGANPDLANTHGCTALMNAAGKGSLRVMRLLVEAKAEINAVDEDGYTAFHVTCSDNHPECAEALVRAGCDTSLRDTDGMTGGTSRKGTATRRCWSG